MNDILNKLDWFKKCLDLDTVYFVEIRHKPHSMNGKVLYEWIDDFYVDNAQNREFILQVCNFIYKNYFTEKYKI